MSVAFSVVIPAYNYGHCLERAVKSVLTQDYPHFEVLVIDDGSTDNTAKVMAGLQEASGAGLRCFHQQNKGLAAVRNRGVDEAGTDWLIFLDADDEMCPGALQALQNAIETHPSARLIIGAHETDTTGVRERVSAPRVSTTREANFRDYLSKKIGISNGACAMHRDLFTTVTYESTLRHTEDIPVFAHILANYDVAVTPEPLVVIHKHAGSMRNDVDAAMKVGMSLERYIFEGNGLPLWAGEYRRAYRARRALSLLKLAEKGGYPDLVRRFFLIALCADPRQALTPRYVRRFVSCLFKRMRNAS